MYYKFLNNETLSSESSVAQWCDGFIKLLPANMSEGVYFKYEVKYDSINNIYYPVIIQHVHGIDYRYALDNQFMSTTDYQLLKDMNAKVFDLIEDGGYVQVGTKEVPVTNFHQAYELLMKQGFSGVKIQRYKGLGEMNKEQLSETTMNPDTRSLLRVSITDAMEADRLFTELMGEDVENRKVFIAENASKANLDI